MAWIKRNLFFLSGILVALALIGLGGWYFYTQYSAERESSKEIEAQYDTLRQLATKNPHPGKAGSATDNVKTAQEEKGQALGLAEKMRASFQPPSPLAGGGNFSKQLDSTVQQLKNDARDSGVNLPNNGDYFFTFQTERRMLNLPQSDSPKLLAYLADVRSICEILFEAKINYLDSFEREMIPGIETNGPDFLPPGGTGGSSPVAKMTPYKIGFRCFSGELATIMGSLSTLPQGYVVKYVDVEPASSPRAAGPLTAPGPGKKPVTFLNENLLGVTLFIEVIQPSSAGQPASRL